MSTFNLGEIPSVFSFVCAALTVLVPLALNWIFKKVKDNGSPTWWENDE
ncbi:hypothetical protein RB620_01675 [Paenibacillus sp. LHD-117]|nr:hypothetical protein [Paenibacillus sp. LHD-117]MDQ6418136.1 hypothetical protein [Paenibacillus sp. LHD-117]